MISTRKDIARLQSDFYRDQFRRLLRWLMVSLVMILLLIGGVAYFIFVKPVPQYYANTTNGVILPMPRSISLA